MKEYEQNNIIESKEIMQRITNNGMKEIGKSAIILYLKLLTPQTICGKPQHDENGKIIAHIKPEWLTTLEQNCEKYPNKIHLVSFNEFDEAFSIVKSLVLKILLTNTVYDTWKIPDNAVILVDGLDKTAYFGKGNKEKTSHTH